MNFEPLRSKVRDNAVSDLDRYPKPKDFSEQRRAKIKCGYCPRNYFCNLDAKVCGVEPKINRFDGLAEFAYQRADMPVYPVRTRRDDVSGMTLNGV